MTSTATTVVGWSLILGVGGIAYWQYRSSRGRRPNVAARAGRPVAAAERQRGGSKDRRKKDKGVDIQEVDNSPTIDSHEEVKNRKKKRDGKAKQGASSSAVDATPDTARTLPPSRPEKEEDDITFAQQLASTQSGTTLKTPGRISQKVRTTKVKSSKQEAGWQSSGTSSSHGGDADEDTSPGLSPDLTAIPTAGQDVSGVEDMLEKPTPGPSTLRVTPAEKPQRETTPRQPTKPAVEEETKKQRQRRRRREAEKAAIAEAETERRRLMEKQLKTARTAEGTAKSGQYRTYTPPTTNAWSNTGNPAGRAQEIAPVGNSELLDTFEVDSSTPVANPNGPEPVTAPLDAPSDGSRPSIDSEPVSAEGSVGAEHQEPIIADPSDLSHSGHHSDAWEDYQLRTIQQREKDNDGWTEVPAKGKKKATK